MARRPALFILATMLLCGCAVPPTPAERLAADVATCRRHAAEGPGGPSGLVGNRNLNTLNPSSLQSLSGLKPTQSLQEGIYWDCLQQRGYSMPRGSDKPLDPDAVGIADGPASPA